MSSSNNNANIDPFSYSFSFPSPFFGHDEALIPPNPNFIRNDFTNFTDPLSQGLIGEHFCPSYDCNLPTEKKKYMRSKINTSRGPRERRIRLSLKVAQRFFDLQDMLGFDKASKTLNWLLKKSDSAIEELKKMNSGYVICDNGCEENSQFHTFECEVFSDHTNKKPKIQKMSNNFAREKRSNKSPSQLVARESRAKARERARQRTKEKMGAPNACEKDIMNLKNQDFPIFNQIETSYSESMMVNCSISELNSSLNISQAQRTSTINNPISINRNSVNPFMIFNDARPSNDYQNWESIDVVAPQSFLYRQTIASPEIEFPNFENIMEGSNCINQSR